METSRGITKFINVYESIEDSAEIIIGINEGKDIYIESFSVDGIEEIEPYLVERELTFSIGEIYNKDKIDHSQRRVLETGIFSFAQISPIPVPGNASFSIKFNKTSSTLSPFFST